MKFSCILLAIVASALPLAGLSQAPTQRSGKEVVQSVCFQCHESAASPAPKVGNRDAWVPRLSKGLDNLVMSAIRGHGGMPPRGGHAELTDVEIRSAIIYMFDPSGASAAAPKPSAPKAPSNARCETTAGLRVCMGMMSAAEMKAFRPGSPEAKMHGGIPTDDGYQHLNISLANSASGAPVAGARVKVEIEQLGVGTESKGLEPMDVGGAGSYGAYVRLLPHGIYTLRVKVVPPGSGLPVEVDFRL